jgi:hypothetical protein
MGHRARRRRRQASRPAALRAHVLRAVPGARVDVRVHRGAAAPRVVAGSDAAAARRRRALHGGRGVPPVGAAALSQRDLARLCADGVGLPLRRRARRRCAELAAPRVRRGPGGTSLSLMGWGRGVP